MRLYRKSAASGARLNYGTELGVGLATFPKTKALVGSLDEAQAPLDAAATAVVSAQKATLPLQVARRFAEYTCDAMVRVVHGKCKEADGGREGAITKEVFPDGLRAEVAPKGAGQLAATKKLRARVEESGLAELKAIKDGLLAQIDAAYMPFVAADKALADATEAVAKARAIESARRADHRRTIDAIFGEIRTAYPGDRAIHDVIVPDPDDGGEGDDTADEPTEPTPTPPVG